MAEGSIFVDTSGRITGTIKKDDGTVLAGSAISALTITIRDRKTRTVVNSNLDKALTPPTTYVDSGGVISIPLLPADQAMIGTGAQEIHRIVLKFAWNTGADKGAAVCDYTVAQPGEV